jgi:hypothetical protein
MTYYFQWISTHQNSLYKLGNERDKTNRPLIWHQGHGITFLFGTLDSFYIFHTHESWSLQFFQLFWDNLMFKDTLFLRLKCGEFLQLLIGHVNGRDSPPLATIHEDTRRLLGETSASLIWAASQFGSTLDPEQRLTALQIQARRILESLDLYWMLKLMPAIVGI